MDAVGDPGLGAGEGAGLPDEGGVELDPFPVASAPPPQAATDMAIRSPKAPYKSDLEVT